MKLKQLTTENTEKVFSVFSVPPLYFVVQAFCLLCALLPALAQASALDKLKAFVENTKSGKATFTQTVVAKSGRKPQVASGTMMFSRPGKFRWVYEQPYYQLIVGDGEKLWIYDRDLNQVTSKKLATSLGSSPAALLAGNNELEKNFNLKEGSAEGDIEWVDAQPKTADTSFEFMRIGFAGDTLRAMELRDNFGQTTRLIFSQFERNPTLATSQFHFTPPKGADLLGE